MLTLRIPFTFEDGQTSVVSNVDTIVQQEIIGYFMTSSGERVMNGSYGGNLNSLVFEINDPLVLADYKIDTLPNVNANIRFGKVLDMNVVSSAPGRDYEDGVLPVIVRYSTSPRSISTLRLNLNASLLTEESDL